MSQHKQMDRVECPNDLTTGSQNGDTYNARFVRSRKRWEQYTMSLEVAPAPLHVDIELTNHCDLDCVMCERRNMNRPKGMMSMEMFQAVINECRDMRVDSIKLNLWGESLLHKRIIDMIRYTIQIHPF